MIMQVVYHDNSSGRIDSSILEEMLSKKKVQKFMRSSGWVSAANASIRGEGGVYEGVDRRGMYGLTGEMAFRIVT